ncbi:MAG: 2-oxoglutarate dehydrogenase complex dihydrolipoyllysine-residue succinyltransferase [Alphaproteobacteria bacterium]|nr:2-oxoglutarate dehydrogenase complex dihydrolipoyllysine-residue succinyltransferase [Alphaproteobacteria bacterium]MCY4499358.1 2-oxoglutarate dehydrogenase complex dihydrolipoyllysine-residue succinyltransferase [Rhodospirillaceae bacterium]
MATEIRVPALGESVTEATVARWFKGIGEPVARDEIICELETDKVALEVPAPAAGTIEAIDAGEGDTVEAGAVLGRIAEGAGAPAEPSAPATPATAPVPALAKADALLSPAVRRLVEEHGLDPTAITGTGKDGRILKGDVLAFIENSSAAAPPTPGGGSGVVASAPGVSERERRVPMTRLRRRIAEHLKDAQNTAAILTTFNEADMGAIIALRAAHRDDFERKHRVRLGFMSFFVKACTVALKEIPEVNAEIENDDLVYKNYYDIGVAVGTPQGLVVPVVRDADRLGFSEIERTIGDLGRRARDGKLRLDEITGGTFTITNGGVYGSLLSTPILNPPQSGILGMHKIQERAMVVNGTVEARPMMYLALSYDHRIIDGREAVTFLVRVKECLENPQRMLLDL